MIAAELKDPRIGFVTVTRVELAADLRKARVYVGVLGSEARARQDPGRPAAGGGLHAPRAGPAAAVRHTPELDFKYDEGLDATDRVARLLDGGRDAQDAAAPPRATTTRTSAEPAECAAHGVAGRRQAGGAHVARRRRPRAPRAGRPRASGTPAPSTPSPPACCRLHRQGHAARALPRRRRQGLPRDGAPRLRDHHRRPHGRSPRRAAARRASPAEVLERACRAPHRPARAGAARVLREAGGGAPRSTTSPAGGIDAAAPGRRPITVHALDVLGHEGDRVEIEVRCSAGTYVRALARDLGEALGTGGHLSRCGAR